MNEIGPDLWHLLGVAEDESRYVVLDNVEAVTTQDPETGAPCRVTITPCTKRMDLVKQLTPEVQNKLDTGEYRLGKLSPAFAVRNIETKAIQGLRR